MIAFLFYGRLATEGRKDRITEKERARSYLFDAAQERLAQIRANRAKAESRDRESRERSKMIDNIIREVIASCTIDPFRELDKFAASLRREVDNANDFFPVDFYVSETNRK